MNTIIQCVGGRRRLSCARGGDGRINPGLVMGIVSVRSKLDRVRGGDQDGDELCCSESGKRGAAVVVHLLHLAGHFGALDKVVPASVSTLIQRGPLRLADIVRVESSDEFSWAREERFPIPFTI